MFFFRVMALPVTVLLQTWVLWKDKGKAAALLTSAAEMWKAQGIRQVCAAAYSVAEGRIRTVFFRLRGSRHRDGSLHIAFCPTGGLGDYIISARLLEEIRTICPMKVTVFCEKPTYGKAVYGMGEDVRVSGYENFERERWGCDLALYVEHFVHIKNADQKRLKMLSPELYRRVHLIRRHWKRLYVETGEQCYRERVQFERCRTLGLNRWTELRMGGAFQMADQKVRIPMQESYGAMWNRRGMGSKRYITVNYGTDRMRRRGRQVKLWPKTYYERLIRECRKDIPGSAFIQIGDAQAERIAGADLYLLGENLELIKWVLRGAFCHIDCEGGLVHLATQLGTKCIVVFGPTPVHMYAYPQNRNLQSGQCQNCMGLHKDWAYHCFRGEEEAACMRAVTWDMVFRELRRLVAADDPEDKGKAQEDETVSPGYMEI